MQKHIISVNIQKFQIRADYQYFLEHTTDVQCISPLRSKAEGILDYPEQMSTKQLLTFIDMISLRPSSENMSPFFLAHVQTSILHDSLYN